MNVRIFWVCVMKYVCAQTRPRFILSSERVLGEMEFEPMLTPREKSPLPENFPRGGSNPQRCIAQDSESKHYQWAIPAPQPWRRNVTTSVAGKEMVTHTSISPQSGEPQRSCWEHRSRRRFKRTGVSWTFRVVSLHVHTEVYCLRTILCRPGPLFIMFGIDFNS